MQLEQLINFEKYVREIQVKETPIVNFISEKTIEFTISEKKFLGTLERPLIHQIGSRIWTGEGYHSILKK